jgi:hypothetical protein
MGESAQLNFAPKKNSIWAKFLHISKFFGWTMDEIRPKFLRANLNCVDSPGSPEKISTVHGYWFGFEQNIFQVLSFLVFNAFHILSIQNFEIPLPKNSGRQLLRKFQVFEPKLRVFRTETSVFSNRNLEFSCFKTKIVRFAMIFLSYRNFECWFRDCLRPKLRYIKSIRSFKRSFGWAKTGGILEVSSENELLCKTLKDWYTVIFIFGWNHAVKFRNKNFRANVLRISTIFSQINKFFCFTLGETHPNQKKSPDILRRNFTAWIRPYSRKEFYSVAQFY